VNELWAVLEVQKPFEKMLREMDFRQPPLYFFYIHPYARLAGNDERLLRLPSALMGVASIWLVYLLGGHLFLRREGLLAAFFLAIAPQHIDLSQDMRQYAPWVSRRARPGTHPEGCVIKMGNSGIHISWPASGLK